MLMGKRAERSVYSLAYLPSVVVPVDGSNGRPCRRGDLLVGLVPVWFRSITMYLWRVVVCNTDGSLRDLHEVLIGIG